MALLIGSILIIALHAMVLSATKMMRRAETMQVGLRADMSAQRALRGVSCGTDLTKVRLAPSQRIRRTKAQEGSAVSLITIERLGRGQWRTVAVSSERCALPERCEWDVAARACRDLQAAR